MGRTCIAEIGVLLIGQICFVVMVFILFSVKNIQYISNIIYIYIYIYIYVYFVPTNTPWGTYRNYLLGVSMDTINICITFRHNEISKIMHRTILFRDLLSNVIPCTTKCTLQASVFILPLFLMKVTPEVDIAPTIVLKNQISSFDLCINSYCKYMSYVALQGKTNQSLNRTVAN